MSREDGFSRADIDSAIFDDLKFRRLWKRLGHQGLMAEAAVLYMATVLRSWHDGQRAVAEDAVPDWLTPSPESIAALKAVGLLEADHRVPRRAFEGWFRPAWERRERMRSGGRVGASRRWDESPRSQSDSQTDRQTGNPIDPPLGTPIGTPLAPLLRQASPISEDDRTRRREEAITTSQSILDDPNATDDAKRIALKGLQRLGAWPTPEEQAE